MLLALRVIVPVVLYLVSLMFFGSIPGRAVRNAAGHVSGAGKRAVAAIGRARDVVRGRPTVDTSAPTVVHAAEHVDPHARTEISTVGHAPPTGPAARARIQDADSPVPVRITDRPSRPDEAAAAEEEALVTEEADIRPSLPRDRRAR